MPNINKTEVVESIKIGLNRGYRQNILLLSSFNNFIDEIREYLLTVNVAQQLLEWNEGHDYKIRIEYPVLFFYNNAFLEFDLDVSDFFNTVIVFRGAGHSPTTKLYQKIDIAITEEQQGAIASTHERTLVGIELKGINKSEADIIADAQRMAFAMIRTDKVSLNSIEFCACGFLRRFDKPEEMVTQSMIQTFFAKENATWQTICNNLNNQFPSLLFEIEIFEVERTPLDAVIDMHKRMGSDYSEVAKDTGIVAGGVLIINRK